MGMEGQHSFVLHSTFSIIFIIEEMSTLMRDQKDSPIMTCESFSSRLPLQEQSSNTLSRPFIVQIQELMFEITRKKAELREAKLQRDNILGKSQQQDARIKDIKILMDHSIDKQRFLREKNEMMEEQIEKEHEILRAKAMEKKELKERLNYQADLLIASKKEKLRLQRSVEELECLIRSKHIENQALDSDLQEMEMLQNEKQNEVRAKQDEISNKAIERAELISLKGHLEDKIKILVRSRHNTSCEQKQLINETVKCEQKINSIKKEVTELSWSCKQGELQNDQIEEINEKLRNDLEAAMKHLEAMKKANKLLEDSLQAYGATGDKVNQIINSARHH